MSYDALPAWFRQIAETVCTPQELEVLKDKAHPWMTWSKMATKTGIAPTTLRSRFDSAARKITNHPDWKTHHDAS